jgi:MoxR-like ATPase
MSVPKKPQTTSAPREREPSPTELGVPIGPRALDLLSLAYRARRPVLLEGPTGIGKSQIVAELARASGIDFVVLDLSLLEPPDLVGLPIVEGGRTRYASPAELPTRGRGILMLEELNRAEIPVMQPALQLLSARRLHAYELPPGWACVAAINPEDGDYQVNRLDPALRSRFLQITVCADRDAWLGWAARANVHPVIQRVVREHEAAFDHTSPRSWAYASEILHVLRPDEHASVDLLRAALRGYLPTPWALLVIAALAGAPPTPELDAGVALGPESARTLSVRVKELTAQKRPDGVAMLAARLRRLYAGPELSERCDRGTITLAQLEETCAPLPGDLRDQCLDAAVESSAGLALLHGLGHDVASLERYRGSPLAKDVATWRSNAKLHRVRLVARCVLRALSADEPDDARLEALAPELQALVADAGPVGDDLLRWLRARGLDRSGAAS